MTATREYVATFSQEELTQIVKDQELFEKQGFIGECDLRARQKILRPNCLGAIETIFSCG